MAKGTLALLAGIPGSPSKGGAPGKPSGEDTSPKRMAAQDMLDAFESGDAAALETAFQRMYDACALEKPADDEYETGDEEI